MSDSQRKKKLIDVAVLSIATLTVIGSSLDGVGGGTVPDPYGPELLVNPSFAGYVAGSPGTPPTGWLNLRTNGSLAAPTLTFGAAAGRRAIYR